MTARGKRLLRKRVEAWKRAGLCGENVPSRSRDPTSSAETLRLEQAHPGRSTQNQPALPHPADPVAPPVFRAGQIWCSETGQPDFRVDSADLQQVLITWLIEGRHGSTHELAVRDLLRYIERNRLRTA